MSLVPFTVDVVRVTEIETDYGGDTADPSTLYRDLTVTFNFRSEGRRRARREQDAMGTAAGPGVMALRHGVIFLDPKPEGVTFAIDDYLIAQDGDYEGSAFQVTGVRVYENEIQLDVEERDSTPQVPGDD